MRRQQHVTYRGAVCTSTDILPPHLEYVWEVCVTAQEMSQGGPATCQSSKTQGGTGFTPRSGLHTHGRGHTLCLCPRKLQVKIGCTCFTAGPDLRANQLSDHPSFPGIPLHPCPSPSLRFQNLP